MSNKGPNPVELALIAATLHKGTIAPEKKEAKELVDSAMTLIQAADEKIRSDQVKEVVGEDKVAFRRKKGGQVEEIKAEPVPISTKAFLRKVLQTKSHNQNIEWLNNYASEDYDLQLEVFRIFWPETNGIPPENSEYFRWYEECKEAKNDLLGCPLISPDLPIKIFNLFKEKETMSTESQIIALGGFIDRLNEISTGGASDHGSAPHRK